MLASPGRGIDLSILVSSTNRMSYFKVLSSSHTTDLKEGKTAAQYICAMEGSALQRL